MSASGLVMTRLVKPEPGPVVVPVVVSAAKRRSFAFVVVAEPLFATVLVPDACAVTSTGLTASSPLYSRIRTSGYAAAGENATVTALVFAEAEAMFFA